MSAVETEGVTTGPHSAASMFRARACIVSAAVLWSLGSLFIRLLKEPTALGLEKPALSSVQMAFFRALFAGLLVVPLVRRADVRFRPRMLGMVLAFAAMSGLYLSALDRGAAANAIFLQNTAPFWVYLIGVFLLGERADRRSAQAIGIGLVGAATIVVGGWPTGLDVERRDDEIAILFMALSSGACYAAVILFLRSLRDESPAWLVLLNHLGSAAALAAFAFAAVGQYEWWKWLALPTGRQLAFLAAFGAIQMALPYWLFARGLRTVSAQEAGLITLLEPLLNPLWAYLVTPDKDRPTWPMAVGGALIFGALLWRYVPRPAER